MASFKDERQIMSKDKEKKVMRLPEVMEEVGVGKDTVYKLMRVGKFPKNRTMRDMPSRRIWLRSEVEAWINGQ